jgi:hypothetical protein
VTPPRFYWTAHPGDLIRTRLLPGAHVLIVASAFWDADRGRFRICRPPANHIASLAIDSGGFTAARKWGRYPWTPSSTSTGSAPSPATCPSTGAPSWTTPASAT